MRPKEIKAVDPESRLVALRDRLGAIAGDNGSSHRASDLSPGSARPAPANPSTSPSAFQSRVGDGDCYTSGRFENDSDREGARQHAGWEYQADDAGRWADRADLWVNSKILRGELLPEVSAKTHGAILDDSSNKMAQVNSRTGPMVVMGHVSYQDGLFGVPRALERIRTDDDDGHSSGTGLPITPSSELHDVHDDTFTGSIITMPIPLIIQLYGFI